MLVVGGGGVEKEEGSERDGGRVRGVRERCRKTGH